MISIDVYLLIIIQHFLLARVIFSSNSLVNSLLSIKLQSAHFIAKVFVPFQIIVNANFGVKPN
jgi:hypothetical protein